MKALKDSVKKEAKQKMKRQGDFSEEYQNRKIRVVLGDGEAVEGVLVEARRYWIKLEQKAGSSIPQVLYVNKAWIKKIELLD